MMRVHVYNLYRTIIGKTEETTNHIKMMDARSARSEIDF
jgi:hypothetical protein